MKVLSQKVQIAHFRLLGGEPLLHPDIDQFMFYTRKYFPGAYIDIVTNGLLLPQMNASFWNMCKKADIEIKISQYPVTVDKINKYVDLMKRENVKFELFPNHDTFIYSINIRGDSDKEKVFRKCKEYKSVCINLWRSKLHLCGRCYNEFLKNYFDVRLPVSTGVDFYKCSGTEIYNYVTHPNELCSYCLLVDRIPFKWGISEKKLNEWII